MHNILIQVYMHVIVYTPMVHTPYAVFDISAEICENPYGFHRGSSASTVVIPQKSD